jgi:hypothetical protein
MHEGPTRSCSERTELVFNERRLCDEQENGRYSEEGRDCQLVIEMQEIHKIKLGHPKAGSAWMGLSGDSEMNIQSLGTLIEWDHKVALFAPT